MTGVVKLVPVDKAAPPEEAANQLIVPADDEAPKSTAPELQLAPGVVPVIVGIGFTITFVGVDA